MPNRKTCTPHVSYANTVPSASLSRRHSLVRGHSSFCLKFQVSRRVASNGWSTFVVSRSHVPMTSVAEYDGYMSCSDKVGVNFKLLPSLIKLQPKRTPPSSPPLCMTSLGFLPWGT